MRSQALVLLSPTPLLALPSEAFGGVIQEVLLPVEQQTAL